MALATTCPACSTSFKVNPEQLKLRRGLVRCGKCDHVFSGVEYLRYVNDSRTDEELNEDNDGQDRRRGDRRGTGRRLWGNSEPTPTDELKTAFFLPDTELGSDESAGDEPGNVALKNPASSDADPDAATSSDPAAAAVEAEQAASSDAVIEAKDDAKDEVKEKSKADHQEASNDSSDESEQNATGKRGRRGGARGKRGRGRRKRAAAKNQSESKNESQAASETEQDKNRNTHAADQADKSESPETPVQENPITAQSETLAQAKPEDKPGNQSTKNPTPDSSRPDPYSTRSKTRAGAVITSPLTKGSRGDFQKSGRDDHWPAAPVWPKIDENFDEPDIEEPDSTPGPAGLAVDDAKPSQADNKPKPASKQPPTQVNADDLAVASLAAGDGPHEEDAIDFFGRTSRPTFDFDLPPRQVLIIAGALIVLLFLQLAIGNRDVLASRFPALSGSLAAISAPLGLKVQLPMNHEEIKIASFDLTAASSREPDASYVMNLLMRNNARYALRWPAIELTLLDGVGGILVRKVLMPSEYLADESLVAAGLPSSSEQPIRVALKSSTDAPVGYSVSLFYP